MTISVKTGSNYSQVSQPYYKTSAGVWTPLKTVHYMSSPGVWTEVWPQQQLYIHQGYGYNMNVAACFGNPTSPSTFYFVNQGYIGGTLGGQAVGALTDFALTIGSFPAGSTVIIINNWVIAGSGGDGAAYYSNGKGQYSGDYNARQGGHGILVNYPCQIDNTNGYIRGGGGGGGARGEWGGSNDNHAPGCGGAGIPGGRANLTGWNPTLTGDGSIDYWPGVPGTETAGGHRGGSWTGKGGNPGEPGQRMTNNISKDGQRELPPAGAGFAVYGMSNITSAQGFVAGKIVGPTA